MKRGFTLLEMFIALSVSAIMIAAVGGLIASVWTLARGSSDEMQGALHARAIRERLFYNLADRDGSNRGYGLTSATNILFVAGANCEIVAQFSGGKLPRALSFTDAKDVQLYSLDASHNRATDYLTGAGLQYVYLRADTASAQFCDRLIVPVFGQHPTTEAIAQAFGGTWTWD